MSDHSRAQASTAPRGGHLLCRRYVAVYFSRVATTGKIGAERWPVHHWALGVLSDGQSEALGAWQQEASGAMNWRQALADMKDRGVERIRFAVSGDLVNFREDLRAEFPGTMALPSFAQLLDRSASRVAARHRSPVGERLREIIQADSGLAARAALAEFESSRWGVSYPELAADWRLALEQGWALWSLALPLRRVVLSGDGVAAALNRSLCKAVGRHGCFAGAEAAESFVKAALARAQRRLDEAQVAAEAEHNHHREGSGSRIAVLGI